MTYWSWVPGEGTTVDNFNRTHPDICIRWSNVGAGTVEYEKLTAALKAGTGAPDVAGVEYQEISTYTLAHDLVNLVPYGANSVKGEFVPWTWHQFVSGSGVYGIPTNTGPMGLLYNAKIFQKYHLAVPSTWAQFAADAAKLHSENPKVYMTDFEGTDGGWLNGLLWQAGADPFDVSGQSNISINFVNPTTDRIASYWQNLISHHEVQSITDFTSQFYSELGNGTLASWITAAWGPDDFSGTAAAATKGDWRVALLPQWTAGAHASADWGSGGDVVTNQCKGQCVKDALTFMKWYSTSGAAWKTVGTEPSLLFPAAKPILSSSLVTNNKIPLTGSQLFDRVFATSAKDINGNFTFSPFQDYVYTKMTDDFNVGHDGTTVESALHQLESQLESYASSEGFHVSS